MFTLETGSGLWNPLAWLIAAIVLFIIAYWIRTFGEKGYKKGTDQEKIFFAGNEAPAVEAQHVRAANLYWGFKEGIGRWFEMLRDMHTGLATDYVLWFILTLAVILIIISLGKGVVQ